MRIKVSLQWSYGDEIYDTYHFIVHCSNVDIKKQRLFRDNMM